MEERMKELTAEANEAVPLKYKNVYIYGDPGTGKSWLARNTRGPRTYLKAQNK
jgi:DNA replication protein DnaC